MSCSEFLSPYQIDLAFITESWLKESIDDSGISIPMDTLFSAGIGKQIAMGAFAFT